MIADADYVDRFLGPSHILGGDLKDRTFVGMSLIPGHHVKSYKTLLTRAFCGKLMNEKRECWLKWRSYKDFSVLLRHVFTLKNSHHVT